MSSTRANPEHSSTCPFSIRSAKVSGTHVHLLLDQEMDIDLLPATEDFSISLPLCEADSSANFRPVHIDMQHEPGEERLATVLTLTLDKTLPPASELRLHYHPQEHFMWSNTLGDSVDAFIAQVPIKITRPAAKDSIGDKLNDALGVKPKATPKGASLPPVITQIDDQLLVISLNRQLIPHQGVASGDFRIEADNRWIDVQAAAVSASGGQQPQELKLALKQPIPKNHTITLVFKARRYPLTAMDGTQLSNFKITVHYHGGGQFQLVDASEVSEHYTNEFEVEKLHLEALESVLSTAESSKQVWSNFMQSASATLTRVMGTQIVKTERTISVSRTQRLILVALALIIVWLALTIGKLVSGFGQFEATAPSTLAASSARVSKPCSLDLGSGNQYQGMCNGVEQPHGQGTFKWKSGSVYKGDFVDGLRQGQGFMTYSNGAKYDGQWRADKKDGEGTYWNTSGDRFEGLFTEGKMTSKGTCFKASGVKLKGFCPS